MPNFIMNYNLQLIKYHTGGWGNDTFQATGFTDYFNGGRGGSDTVSYANSSQGVYANLQYGSGVGGLAQGDKFYNIDNLTGSNSGDDLYGNSRSNTLRGLDGNDNLVGNNGSDFLSGGDGQDELTPFTWRAHGNATLEGGANADTFVFVDNPHYHGAGSHANATITDFQAGLDQLDFSGSNQIDSWADVFNHATLGGTYGQDTIIEFSNTTVTLENTRLSSLDADDFIF